jgi:hypothetical protein
MLPQSAHCNQYSASRVYPPIRAARVTDKTKILWPKIQWKCGSFAAVDVLILTRTLDRLQEDALIELFTHGTHGSRRVS